MGLELVELLPLMEQATGRPEVAIGLIDGPVAIQHPELATENIREVPGKYAGTCARSNKRGLSARDVRCRDIVSQERFGRPGHLPRLHLVGAADFFRDEFRQRGYAQGNSSGIGFSDRPSDRCRCANS